MSEIKRTPEQQAFLDELIRRGRIWTDRGCPNHPFESFQDSIYCQVCSGTATGFQHQRGSTGGTDPEVRGSIQKIINYNWVSESADYAKHPDDTHIWLDLKRVQRWIEETAKEAL